MAESGNFPQLPRSVWRGTWEILRKTPKRKLDEKALAIELAVQPTAAKAYARELVRLGLLKEDFTPSDLANRWRQDGQATDVIDEIVKSAYPSDLRDLAPRDALDREKIVRWFMSEGLGEGSAKNKAATYIMVNSGVADEGDTPPPKPRKVAGTGRNATESNTNLRQDEGSNRGGKGGNSSTGEADKQRKPDLNVNIQIHISADATPDQIDSIFSSMKRYFDAAD